MAHANIFEKVNKNNTPDPSLSNATIETMKLLNDEMKRLKDIIDEQHNVIHDLAQTVTDLKADQKESNENHKLMHIDQKDLLKQLRALKAEVESTQYLNSVQTVASPNIPIQQTTQAIEPVQPTTPVQEIPRVTHQMEESSFDDKEIEELFFNNSPESPIMKNHTASNAIQQALNEIKKLEKPKQRVLAKRQAAQQQVAQKPVMEKTVTRKVALRPKAVQPVAREEKLSNQDLVKRMIFGKTSKLIK